MPTRLCPFPGCTCRIPPEFFACAHHWRRMTSDERNVASSLYGSWQCGQLPPADLAEAQRKLVEDVRARQADDRKVKRTEGGGRGR